MAHFKTLNFFSLKYLKINSTCCSFRKTLSVMTLKPTLYGDEASPLVRFTMMTASLLKIKVDFRRIDLFASENKNESYKKINPLGKVPALVVENEVICDSHAISLYFCRIGDHEKMLYPKEALLRAKVDEMLFFNSSMLFPTDSAILSNFFASCPVDENKTKEWLNLMDFLENRLMKYPWLAGDKMFICDISAAAIVTSVICLVPLADHHINVKEWLRKLKSKSFFKINEEGLTRLHKYINMVQQRTYY